MKKRRDFNFNNKQKNMDTPEFNRLLERYQQGQLDGKEKQFMDDWFDSMADSNVHQLWTSDDKQALKKRINKELHMNAPARDHVRLLSSSWTWRISASVVLIIAASFLGWRYINTPAELLSEQSSTGKVNKVLLSDGSIVWLKNNSSLTYPERFDKDTRNVTLIGEALFEVAKDARHPFIIQCGDLTTTVLGTSFNIRQSKSHVEVVVLTGKVSLTSPSKITRKKRVVQIVPNEKAIYNEAVGQMETMEAAKDETVAAVKGTEYNMHFEDTRMDEIIRRIEGKFSVEISVENPTLANCVVTADFTDQSLNKTLDILSKVLAVHYEIGEKQVKLTGKGCN